MVIISAADEKYFTGLANLVGSVHYWSPKSLVVIYDLGLSNQQKREILTWRSTHLIHDIPGNEVPLHCHQLKLYAWKPVILAHAIEHYDSILWVDAGSDVRAPLCQIKRELESDGYFFVQGQDLDMTEQSHRATYYALGTEITTFIGKPHFAGNLQGYVSNSDAHKRVLTPLYTHALDKQCIAPEGSNLANHRYDQTLLSILIYQSGIQVTPKTRHLAASREQLHSDPLHSSAYSVYTARCSSIDYLDQVRNLDGKVCYAEQVARHLAGCTL